MKRIKEQLYYLKAKILKLQDVTDNIRLELTNDIYKIEQALNIDDVSNNEVACCGNCHLPLDNIEMVNKIQIADKKYNP